MRTIPRIDVFTLFKGTEIDDSAEKRHNSFAKKSLNLGAHANFLLCNVGISLGCPRNRFQYLFSFFYFISIFLSRSLSVLPSRSASYFHALLSKWERIFANKKFRTPKQTSIIKATRSSCATFAKLAWLESMLSFCLQLFNLCLLDVLQHLRQMGKNFLNSYIFARNFSDESFFSP